MLVEIGHDRIEPSRETGALLTRGERGALFAFRRMVELAAARGRLTQARGSAAGALAAGAAGLLLDETCCDPFYRKAIRVSVGAALSAAAREVGSVRLVLGWLPAPINSATVVWGQSREQWRARRRG